MEAEETISIANVRMHVERVPVIALASNAKVHHLAENIAHTILTIREEDDCPFNDRMICICDWIYGNRSKSHIGSYKIINFKEFKAV